MKNKNQIDQMHTLKIFKLFLLVGVIGLVVSIAGCSRNDHFLTGRKYRRQVLSDFREREKLAENRKEELFGVFTKALSLQEKEAMRFLYAYMPLADLAEYDGDFFLRNVQHSLLTLKEMPWGKKVPVDIFRHFVLPVRVNNENLDSSRWIFFDELKDRVKNLSMTDAALEVNHWCHEKVTYKSTDGRTSSPLSTVKNAFGRCGEESVFTVAALRSVGIPARQVYVPRWAHSDDNHAWVEVWADGRWHYLGACEPEPVLNRGWFTGPARRTMLVHTRVFGRYDGAEEVVKSERDYAIINSTAIYAEVTQPVVTVVDSAGKPVRDAKVDFGLYNYAEFYPIASLVTDKHGTCSLTIGKGDILLHASYAGECTWGKYNLRTDTAITLTLGPCTLPAEPDTWHLDVPDEVTAEGDALPEPVKQAHQLRTKYEDSLRNSYTATFPDKRQMVKLAGELKAPADSIIKYLSISQGNHHEITAYLREALKTQPGKAFPLLSCLTEKDIRDTRAETLLAVLAELPEHEGSDHILPYVFSPKVDLELLKPYKRLLWDFFREEGISGPENLFGWIRHHIAVDTTPYYSRILMTPSGVHSLRVTDPASRDIYFVAACRSTGIAARLDPATRIPQALVNGIWKDFSFERGKEDAQATPGRLELKIPKEAGDPAYFVRFTISKLEDGIFNTLEYPENQPISAFTFPLELRPGSYALISSLRQANGDVDAIRSYFMIHPDSLTVLDFPVPIPQTTVYGVFPGPATGKPFLFLALEATGEPSRHLLQELQNRIMDAKSPMPEVWVMFADREAEKGKELLKKYKLEGKVFFREYNADLLNAIRKLQPGKPLPLPVTAGINPKNEVVFLAGGYQINSIRTAAESAGL